MIFTAMFVRVNVLICYCRFDLDFSEWVVEIGWYTYWNAMYVVMIAMLLHALNSLLLYYATLTESTTLLVVSMILRFLQIFPQHFCI
jgi:hypothetical protein